MKQLLPKLVLTLSTFVVLMTATLAAAQARPVGEWLGTLEVGAAKLRLALSIEEKTDGSLSALVNSLDQGAKIAVDTAVFEGGTLRLVIQAIGASYEGTLNADGSVLVGVWSQSGRQLPLTFERQQQAVVLNRPQHP